MHSVGEGPIDCRHFFLLATFHRGFDFLSGFLTLLKVLVQLLNFSYFSCCSFTNCRNRLTLGQLSQNNVVLHLLVQCGKGQETVVCHPVLFLFEVVFFQRQAYSRAVINSSLRQDDLLVFRARYQAQA